MASARVIPSRLVLKFLTSATPGNSLTYAAGSHLPHVCHAPGLGAIRSAYNDGDVELIQRRRHDGETDYVAIRRRVRAKIEPAFKFAPMFLS